MDGKRFVVAFVVVFLVTAVANFVIHGVLLHPRYAQFPTLLRGETDASHHAVFLLVAFAAFSLAFVLIWGLWAPAYSSPVRAGLFYGALMWLVGTVNHYAVNYAVQPWPGDLVLDQIGYEFVWMAVVGMALGAVYRK